MTARAKGRPTRRVLRTQTMCIDDRDVTVDLLACGHMVPTDFDPQEAP